MVCCPSPVDLVSPTPKVARLVRSPVGTDHIMTPDHSYLCEETMGSGVIPSLPKKRGRPAQKVKESAKVDPSASLPGTPSESHEKIRPIEPERHGTSHDSPKQRKLHHQSPSVGPSDADCSTESDRGEAEAPGVRHAEQQANSSSSDEENDPQPTRVSLSKDSHTRRPAAKSGDLNQRKQYSHH
eukprot:GHVN01089955.1.p2 GENE.GHVN01089955.1~~GHVN01089955.1.p2  ORF type:complete len:184 (+),score=27.40 GHVN01089955.1:723-1274(+)